MYFARPVLAAAAAVGIAVATGSAFTASNDMTAAASSVGQGALTTSGFAVSGVQYVFDTAAAHKDKILSVTFTLTAAASKPVATYARVRLVSSDGYTDCTAGTVTGQAVTFTCTFGTTGSGGGVTAASANTLDIVGSSNTA